MMLLGDTSDYLYAAPLSFRLLLGVPIVVIVMAVGAAASTAWAWRTSGAGRFARGHQVALLLGLVALGWFLWQWNLIGWQI
jgi:hypothetical protein